MVISVVTGNVGEFVSDWKWWSFYLWLRVSEGSLVVGEIGGFVSH